MERLLAETESAKIEDYEDLPAVKHALWFVPLIGSAYVIPQIVFLVGYFAADRIIVLIPALAHLGASLFVAIALALIADALLRTIGYTTYNKVEMRVTWPEIRTQALRYVLPIGLIALQNTALVLAAPTLLFGYCASRCALSVLLKKPSLAYWAEIPDIWGFDHTIYARYFLIGFTCFALLNAVIALVFPVGLWVVYTVVAYYGVMVMKIASLQRFDRAAQPSPEPA